MLRGTRILLLLLLLTTTATAQPYTLLIRNGYCIDPASNRRDTFDVAIVDNRIVRIAKRIDPHQAKKQLDARGMIVCPGLIDIHTHVFFAADSATANNTADSDLEYAGGSEALHPDSFSFRSGVTTIVDAGSSGWRNFPTFKARVIDHSQTRVLAFLNIVAAGMRGNPYEQDTLDMNGALTATVARRYPKDIVGIKVAHYLGTSWHPVDAAVSAGMIAHIPVMVDFGEHLPPMPIRQLFEQHLRLHDIFTHCFAQLEDREPIVDPTAGHLKPFVKLEQLKGIVFDVGYGEISFAFSQAIPAIKAGFLPNSISTDLHKGATHDMLDILSQFLAMGVDLPTVITMASWNPAREIGRPRLGSLREGHIADIAILQLEKGDFEATDHLGQTMTSGQKLICIWTIKDGRLVYSRNRPGL